METNIFIIFTSRFINTSENIGRIQVEFGSSVHWTISPCVAPGDEVADDGGPDLDPVAPPMTLRKEKTSSESVYARTVM